ncbi:MAG: ribonuclease III [Fervidobacterium sp.]|nr:ribonuclease III [Fervidobacterium sp.]
MQQEMLKESKSLEIFPEPSVNPNEMSTDSLAYIGDAVFNLYAKLHILTDTKVTELHKMANKYVSREGQSKILKTILPLLNEKEQGIVRRGINSKGAKKHGNDLRYKESTGFEALVGYLYLVDKVRLSYLLKEGLKWDEV